MVKRESGNDKVSDDIKNILGIFDNKVFVVSQLKSFNIR